MQQYRVNYSLLIGLIIGTLVCSGAVYALWRFQIDRKSDWLLAEAQKADDAGDFREAARNYQQYLTIRTGDPDTRIKHASAYAELSKQDDVTGDELNAAWKILESVLRDRTIGEMPEAKDLRTRLVELLGSDRVQRYQDALDHLGYLLERHPDDAELQVLRAKYLVRSGNYDEAVKTSYKLIGYDPVKNSFDPKKAIAPKETEVYTNLAAVLRDKQDKPELAEKVIDQLIEVNPDSAEAYLARGAFRETAGDPESAIEDVEKAYRLAPKDTVVLLTMANRAVKDEDYEKAAEYVATGKKLHPDDHRFYQAAADVCVKQKDYEKALAHIDEGLEAIKGQAASILLISKADLQLQKGDLKDVRHTMDDMTREGFRPEIIDWYAARILLAEDKWYPAAEALNRLRPKVNFGDLPIQIDNYLGLCYEKLGKPEMALEQYKLVLQQDQKNEWALAGKQRVGPQIGVEPAEGEADPWQKMLAKVLALPKAEQNWDEVDRMLLEMAEKRNLDDATVKLMQAQLMLMREDFDGANKALADANDLSPSNLQIWRMKVQLARLNPKEGPAKAMKLWETMAKQFTDPKDQAKLRIDKADILIAMTADDQKKDELKAELAGLMSGIDDWSVPQKVELWRSMAARYLNLGMNDEARQYLTLAAENQPNDLRLRESLFALALDANDDAGMKEAQDKILEIVGSTNDSTWLYSEARRKLSLVRRGQLDNKALEEIRMLVSRAQQQRQAWHELHLLNGELELLAGNAALALEHYDRAEKSGRPYPTAVATHIRLLVAAGRFADAGKLLDRIPEPMRNTLLGQLYPEILFRTNQVESALKQALAATEANPSSAQNHYWYGQLLARSAQAPDTPADNRKATMKQAVAELEKAVELEPEFPQAWFSLIQFHGAQNDIVAAEAALRRAQLSLSGDNLQMFLAQSYEALGRWFDAETMYRTVYEAAPDDLTRVRQLAAFYLGPAYPLPDKQLKVTPLINKILRAGVEEKIPPSDPNLLWARRMGAKMLAATEDYQKLVKAEKLLASSAQDGTLSIEDKLEMAGILAPRSEPESRMKAISLLEEVRELQPLNEQAEIALGELYFAVGSDWSKYFSQMKKAIASFPQSARARAVFVRRLLNRTDQRSLEEAGKQVNELRKIAPQSQDTFELTVRLADKVGVQDKVRAELLSMASKLQEAKELSAEQLQMLSLIAGLLIELDDLDGAEKIYRDLAARSPGQIATLASFLGNHRDADQCFALLNQLYSPDRIPALLQVAMSVVRQKRDKVGDKFDAEIQRWLDTSLRENPDSINLLIVQADLYDLQKKYEEAAGVYRKLLSRNDLTGIRRAVVLNNLSFLVALAGSKAATDVDPLELVEKAAEILGPNSDILDTRAVVLTARQQYQPAIQDLELSVTDNPTASKYFHKADAHLRANQNRDAVAAWEKAEELGLGRDAINRMEFERYEEMKSKIDQLRGSSVTRTEPLRRAG